MLVQLADFEDVLGILRALKGRGVPLVVDFWFRYEHLPVFLDMVIDCSEGWKVYVDEGDHIIFYR